MKIKTLSDIKREMKNKRPYYIVDHMRNEFIGQVRIANVIQANGVYIHEYNNPDSGVTLANNGRGSWLEYGKAKDWEIDKLTGHCYLYHGNHIKDNLVMEIVFFDDKCIEELKTR